ncbi:flagellar basal-body rod protein FlgF [Aidingimonas halophila]|uniref:Flagellar basal-body rod protein FlgF n=1 Tax=Aidingimonas halophila TaxID=574349 RepID=A0A1H3B8P2_9GAMM|nr:flagellar basal-body rod protein FlgF [Aidingimonas halophila]GHC26062.1 flagellar basal body protein [Aidingimonas halophila]SDX38021.1 flagellar basal-body rod protein FlgF [Aidingimonas halophila]
MDRVLYTAMSGAKQTMDQQAVVSNNLANASTTGFRAQMSAMRAVPVEGEGMPTRVSVAASTPVADMSSGPMNATGRALDVAIQDDGWLAVQSDDGGEAYTRRGDLQVDADGLLTSGGRPVIGENGPIVIPLGADVSIGEDGTISALEEGQPPDAIANVGRLKLVDPEDQSLERGDDGLFRPLPDDEGNINALPQNEDVRIATGTLEGSNVSPIETMVAMIDSARRYDMQMKGIETADENAQRANNLLSISG